MFLNVLVPQTIYAINRRNYLRLYQNDIDPIPVTLYLPGKAPLTQIAQDISAGGISLLIPSEFNLPANHIEMGIELHLPGYNALNKMVTLRNRVRCKDGIRLGLEFTDISKENQKELIDYIVKHTLENIFSRRSNFSSDLPLLCMIHDNDKIEESLAYLRQSYRIVRQELNASWNSTAQITPDVLLFNLDQFQQIFYCLKFKR
jgi:c-di-GMP-binding flagellar brake protein YcgR